MTYQLIYGDCLEILPTLDKVNAVVTDPPYGIGVTKMTLGNGKNKIFRGDNEWDTPLTSEHFEKILKSSEKYIIWGGNYFTDFLFASRCWLVWDKCTGDNSFADCELAWTNIDSVVKKYKKSWVGNNAKDTIRRYHPTQKPTELMMWCIELVSSPGDTILDPFMGSGTTGVACIQTGRNFIGIEKERKYFEIAERRISQAQPPLFTESAPAQPTQDKMQID